MTHSLPGSWIFLFLLFSLANAFISWKNSILCPASTLLTNPPLKFATNKQAGYEYEFEEKYEAGIKVSLTPNIFFLK